jgi:hypothetical protein
VDKRFPPHSMYGMSEGSETLKKSFPPSFKRYFFKLVKNIIRVKKGGKTVIEILKNPPTLTMTAGTRANTLADPMVKKS